MYCDPSKHDLEQLGKMRMFGSIPRLSRAIDENSRKNCTFFDNCEHTPLVEREGCVEFLEEVPPMKIHALLGMFKQLYKSLKEAWPKNNEKRVETLNLPKEAYHGGHFNCNACRILLKYANRLESVAVQNEAGTALKYVLAFHSFEKVAVLDFFLSRELIVFSIATILHSNAKTATLIGLNWVEFKVQDTSVSIN